MRVREMAAQICDHFGDTPVRVARPFRDEFDSQFDSHRLGQERIKRTQADRGTLESFRFGRRRPRFNGT